MALWVRSLTDEEREELQRRAQSRTALARAAERVRMVLAVHGGESAPAVACRLGVGTDVVREWLTRFNKDGLAGLEDRPRSGLPQLLPGCYVPPPSSWMSSTTVGSGSCISASSAKWYDTQRRLSPSMRL
jgi:hypothetical protein